MGLSCVDVVIDLIMKRKIVPSVVKQLNKNFPEIELEDLRSDEEFLYLCWLNELCNAGFVSNAWYESETFELYGGYDKMYEEVKKTKTNIKTETLVRRTVYTPDFKVEWLPEASDIFYCDVVSPKKITHNVKPMYHVGDKFVTYVEVKADHNQNNSTSYSQVKMNWLFATQGVYINLVKVPELFKKVFCPDEFFYTEKSRNRRELSYKVKTLGEFLDSRLK